MAKVFLFLTLLFLVSGESSLEYVHESMFLNILSVARKMKYFSLLHYEFQSFHFNPQIKFFFSFSLLFPQSF